MAADPTEITSLPLDELTYYAPPLIGGGIKRCFCLTSVCLSVTYIGPKSRTERPRKTNIGTEVADVTRDSYTTFKVTRSKSRSPGRFGWLYWQADMDIQ